MILRQSTFPPAGVDHMASARGGGYFYHLPTAAAVDAAITHLGEQIASNTSLADNVKKAYREDIDRLLEHRLRLEILASLEDLWRRAA